MPAVDFVTNLPASAITSKFRDSLVQAISDMLNMPVGAIMLHVQASADCQVGLTTADNASESVVVINVSSVQTPFPV
jgi:hypothetical protein